MKTILENVVVTLVCGGIVHVAKSIFNFIKRAELEPRSYKKVTPKKTVQKQFFISLFTFLFSFSGAWALPLKFLLLGAMKIFLMIISLYAFIFVWGAFDAAIAFYPEEDPGDSVPTQDTSKEPGKN